jgi:hypothetical protein
MGNTYSLRPERHSDCYVDTDMLEFHYFLHGAAK